MVQSAEYEYLVSNKSTITNMVLDKKTEQLSKGYNFDEEEFLKDFFRDVRDRKVDISVSIEQNYLSYERKNIKNYLEENEEVDATQFIKSSIKRNIESPIARKTVYTKYGKNLIGEFNITQKRLGSEVAKERAEKRVIHYHNLIQAERDIMNGKLSQDDLRRLRRLEVLFQQNKELLNYHGLAFSSNIDGTIKSHIKCLYKHNSKRIEFILTPSQMVNHTLKKVVYKRENVGSTVTEFKQSIPTLNRMGVSGESLKALVKVVGDSYDLRKTVKDSNGNNV